jgi:hypothetical protein
LDEEIENSIKHYIHEKIEFIDNDMLLPYIFDDYQSDFGNGLLDVLDFIKLYFNNSQLSKFNDLFLKFNNYDFVY